LPLQLQETSIVIADESGILPTVDWAEKISISSLHACVFFRTSDHGQASVFSQRCVICASSLPLRQSADKPFSAEGINLL
jgi:hypothetical protein